MHTFSRQRDESREPLALRWVEFQQRLDDVVIAMFVVSFLALAVAPMFLPASYSWIKNTVSESGGQGVHGAWLVRSGVVLASAAVVILSIRAGALWNRSCQVAFRFYAFALVGVALFADGPWTDAPYNRSEAFFHTFSAFWAAVGFALGVLAVNRTRRSSKLVIGAFDWVVALGTGIIPVVMLVLLDHAGMLQRILALIGYTWLVVEAIRIARHNRVSHRFTARIM